MGMDHFHSQLTHGPLKLALGLLPTLQLFLHGGRLGGSIGRVFVQIHTAGNPVALDPAPKTIQSRYRALMIIETCLDRAGGIVDITHQDQLGASPFQPVMMRSVQLYHLAKTAPPRPPLPMRSGFPLLVGQSSLPQPYAQGFRMNFNPMTLVQLLTGQGRPIIGVMLLKQRQHLLLDLVGNPPIRGLSSATMHNASISLCLNSFHQPPHLSRAQTRHFGRLLLTDLLLQGLTNQVESLDLSWFHPQ